MRSADRYDSLFLYYAEIVGVDWKLLKCQARAESAFDPRAKSPAGAQGLAQFMPPTWAEWGEGDPHNPEDAIRAQALYMEWLLRRVDGDKAKALAAYNWGIGRVIGRFDGIPYDPALVPKETRDYVAKILAWRDEMVERNVPS